MQNTSYIKFKIRQVFDLKSPVKRFNANSVKIYNEQVSGAHPYIVRQASNNGQRGYIIADENYLSNGNTFSFGQDTATIFFQPNSYFTGDKIKILSVKNHVINVN